MRRFLALLIFFAWFFYMTMIYNSQSFMLLFFVSLVLVLVLEIFNFMSCSSLDVECIIPRRMVKAGNDIIVKICLSADSIPSGKVMVCLSCSNSDGRNKRKARVYGHAVTDEDTVVSYAFTEREVGIYSVQITKVRVFDYLGILELPVFCGRQRQLVYVMPNIYTVPMEISERYSDMALKMEPDLSYDTIADESENIREYIPGDSIHDIHWKLTAKKDKIMVMERSLTGGIAIHLLLEGKKTDNPKKLIAFIQTAVSLSRGLAATGNTHYVAWFDGRLNEFVRMAVDDKSQTYEVLRRLMGYSEAVWEKEPDTEIFAKEYKNQFGIMSLPCFLRLDRELSLRIDDQEIIKYKAENLSRQLRKNKLTF